MVPWLLNPVSVTLRRFGAQTISATTHLPVDPVASSTVVTMQEEPWRANASVPRPDGTTAASTRLFVSTVEVRGVGSPASASAAAPDQIVASSGTWRVREAIPAVRVGAIVTAWHAYCVLDLPDTEGEA